MRNTMHHHSTALRRLHTLLIGGALLLLSACSTLDRGTAPALKRQATWVVLPLPTTPKPVGGNRAEAIAQALLHAQGVGKGAAL